MATSRKAIGIFSIAAIVAIGALMLTSGVVSAATRVVNQTAPPCVFDADSYHTTIQAAINAATDGDEIIVCDGTYTEDVDVDRSVTIRSQNGPAVTTVQMASSIVFNVTADYVNISGFTVTGANTIGIQLDTVNYCNISNNNVSGNTFLGIYMIYSNNSILTGNMVNSSAGDGFYLGESNNNTLTGNTANSNAGNGFYLYLRSNNNTLTGNTANSNDGDGFFLSVSCNNNTLTGNTANSNDPYGIDLWRSSNNSITCNWIHNNSESGFYLSGGSTGNTIERNNIMANGVEQPDGSWQYNFYNEQDDNVTAEDNYWGTTNSAVITASINEADGHVDYEPFLTEPAPCAPCEEPQPSPVPVSALTPLGLIALVSLLSAIAAVAVVRKRR